MRSCSPKQTGRLPGSARAVWFAWSALFPFPVVLPSQRAFMDPALLLGGQKRCDHFKQRLRPLAQLQGYPLIGNDCVKIAVGHAVIARPVGGKGEDLASKAAPRAILIVEGAEPIYQIRRRQLVDQDIACPHS